MTPLKVHSLKDKALAIGVVISMLKASKPNRRLQFAIKQLEKKRDSVIKKLMSTKEQSK